MAHHRVLGRRFLAVTLLQHLVLKTAGQRDDTILLGILCQIFLAGFLVHLALLGALCLNLLFLLLEILLNNRLGLTMRHLQLLALQHILDGLGEICGTDILGTHLRQLLSDAQT